MHECDRPISATHTHTHTYRRLCAVLCWSLRMQKTLDSRSKSCRCLRLCHDKKNSLFSYKILFNLHCLRFDGVFFSSFFRSLPVGMEQTQAKHSYVHISWARTRAFDDDAGSYSSKNIQCLHWITGYGDINDTHNASGRERERAAAAAAAHQSRYIKKGNKTSHNQQGKRYAREKKSHRWSEQIERANERARKIIDEEKEVEKKNSTHRVK